MSKNMNILSIHYGHDSSACILRNGKLSLYFKEERFSGIKRDDLPLLSIKKCLDNFNEKITHIAITSTEYNQRYHIIEKFLQANYGNCIDSSAVIVNFTDHHHLSHVGTSFFNSGFDDALVVVVDGRGSSFKHELSECESVFRFSYEKIDRVIKNYFNASYMGFPDTLQETIDEIEKNAEYNGNVFSPCGGIVTAYTTATLLIGQAMEEGGKVMGLSSYGKKIKDFPKIFKDRPGEVNGEYFKIHEYEHLSGFPMPVFKGYEDKITGKITKENYQMYADYAYEIQTQSQKAVGDLIQKSIEKTGVKKVCISGGYGMNIVANHYYIQRFPDVEFYFEPLADDTGGSIGMAKMYWFLETGDKTVRPLTTTSFHGIHYDVSEYKGETKNIAEIAKLLYDNKSVAVYTGMAEAGQRALGNRSILFNALNPDAKDIVNKIKKREWYRPFAAMVLEEDADTYFDMGRIKSSPFMTISFPVKDGYDKVIPGVTHVDKTCRIQTVSKSNGYLYDLLIEFKKLSGHGILLNTSFNLAGQPLVETPHSAFETLKFSSLDYLWFEETNQLFS